MANRHPHVKTKLKGYYTVNEAAEFLRSSHHMTWKWASNGKLPSINVDGRYFIPEADLRSFLKPRRGNPLIGLQTKRRWRAIRKAEKLEKLAEASKKRRTKACYGVA